MAETRFEFGPYSLDRSGRSLRRNGDPVVLPARAFELLVVLVSNRGRVMEKDELLKQVWQDAFVEENNLSVNISVLRKTLAEGAEGTSFIETVPRRGYQFVAPVTVRHEVEPPVAVAPQLVQPALQSSPLVAERTTTTVELIEESHPANRRWLLALAAVPVVVFGLWRLLRPTPAQIQTLAILPFKGPTAADPLGFGIADAVITRLSEPGKILIRPTQAVRLFDVPGKDPLDAGRKLNVDVVLDGTLQREADRIRLTVQLLRVADGKPLWAHSFDNAAADQFALEDSLARQLAEAVNLQLSADWLTRITRGGTSDLEAHRLALEAHRQFFNFSTAGHKKAIELADQAIARDPNYAMAHWVRALAYVNLASSSAGVPPREAMPRGKASALRALQLAPDLPQAHMALSFISLVGDYDPPASERAWRRALELDPNDTGGYEAKRYWCTAMGRFDEAISAAKRNTELVPTGATNWHFAGNALWHAGRYVEAIQYTRRAQEIDPEFGLTLNQMSTIHRLMGMYPQAVAEALKQRARAGATPAAIQELQAAFDHGGIRAYDQKRLDQILDAIQQGRFIAAYAVAVAASQAGDNAKALDWLDKAFEEHDPQIMFMAVEPGFRILRGEPGYEKLRVKLGLP